VSRGIVTGGITGGAVIASGNAKNAHRSYRNLGTLSEASHGIRIDGPDSDASNIRRAVPCLNATVAARNALDRLTHANGGSVSIGGNAREGIPLLRIHLLA